MRETAFECFLGQLEDRRTFFCVTVLFMPRKSVRSEQRRNEIPLIHLSCARTKVKDFYFTGVFTVGQHNALTMDVSAMQ